MKIINIDSSEIIRIQKIAYATWPDTFKNILKSEQIEYMLKWMYNIDTLINQSNNGHLFYIAELNGVDLGFIGIEPNHNENQTVKIHKIYVLPTAQNKGVGKKLINYVIDKMHKEQNQKTFILNVNRYNKATEFYKYLGFNIVKEENISIGNGYLMEDFVMQKNII